ncbi:hypothetical protein [Sphingomonas sp. YL-JM2C]
MTNTMLAMGDGARAGAPDHHHIDALEIALTEDEIASAAILQFDPDAALPHAPGAIGNGADPTMLAVPGHHYSVATWTRLAVGALGGRPGEALARFLKERARRPD